MHNLNIIFSKLQEQNYQEELFVDLLTGESKKTVDGYLVCCPFHADDKPSFHISMTKPVCHCFGCGWRGNWLKYMEEAEGITRMEAFRKLATEAGVELSEELEAEMEQRELVSKIMTEAMDFYVEQFKNLGSESISGYAKSRGFTIETVERFKIGYAPPDDKALYKHLTQEKGFTTDDVLEIGLFIKHDNGTISDLFQGRIVYTYLSCGIPIYFIGGITSKTPAWDKSKYKKQLVCSKERDYISNFISNDYFFNEDVVDMSAVIYITEGVTDCISLNQNGYASISPCTVQPRSEDYEKLAKMLQGKQVYICNDVEANNRGQEGAVKTAEELLK